MAIPPRKYLFIDGASFESTIKSMCGRYLPSDEVLEFVNFNAFSGFQRTFYYDSYPKIDSIDEKDPKYTKKSKIFDEIKRAKNCHVHTGVLRHREKKKTKEQKGVDVMLAIQVMQHAYQGNMDEAHILTSDLDFFPVFDALTQTRVSTILIYDPKKTADDLVYSADRAQNITYGEIYQWLKAPERDYFSYTEISSGQSEFHKTIESISALSLEFEPLDHLEGSKIPVYRRVKDGKYIAKIAENIFAVAGCLEILKEKNKAKKYS